MKKIIICLKYKLIKIESISINNYNHDDKPLPQAIKKYSYNLCLSSSDCSQKKC